MPCDCNTESLHSRLELHLAKVAALTDVQSDKRVEQRIALLFDGPVDLLDELMLHALISPVPELHLLHDVGRKGRDVNAFCLAAGLTDLEDQRQMGLDGGEPESFEDPHKVMPQNSTGSLEVIGPKRIV